jgi:hypothetical protein
MIILGMLFFGCGLIASVVIPFIEPRLIGIWWIWLPVILGYGILAKMCLDAWRQRNNYVKVNEHSISLHSPENQIEKIQWSEISEIRTKNLHLFFGAFLILFICLAAYCLNRGTFIPGVFFVGGSFFILYAFIIEFIGVRIVDDNLTVIIVYPFWKKKISFSRIKELSLELSRAGNSKMSPFVILSDAYPDGSVLQHFTAIGQIVTGDIYQVEMTSDFKPYRLDVGFMKCHETPIKPLIHSLSFIKNKTRWGSAFRFGHLKIPEPDFRIIADAMGAKEVLKKIYSDHAFR